MYARAPCRASRTKYEVCMISRDSVAKNAPLLYGLSGHLKKNEKMETRYFQTK